jgi:GNAT superfamily N-acetyltransferase
MVYTKKYIRQNKLTHKIKKIKGGASIPIITYKQHELISYIGEGPEKKILGSIQYAVPINKDSSIELHTLYIEPEFRNKGYSKKMLRHFLLQMERGYPNVPSIILTNKIGTNQFPFNTSIKPTNNKTIKNIHNHIKNIYEKVGFVYVNNSSDMIYTMKRHRSPNQSHKQSHKQSPKPSLNINPSPTKKRKH